MHLLPFVAFRSVSVDAQSGSGAEPVLADDTSWLVADPGLSYVLASAGLDLSETVQRIEDVLAALVAVHTVEVVSEVEHMIALIESPLLVLHLFVLECMAAAAAWCSPGPKGRGTM